MNEVLLAKIRSAKIAALNVSRTVPTRACSPYGALEYDSAAIKCMAREAFEALYAAEQELLPGPADPMISALHASAVALDEAANIIRSQFPRTASLFNNHAQIARAAIPQ